VLPAERRISLGTEVVLAAAELDVPEAAVAAEKRFGKMRHG
jgi:hypothetical protein